MAYNMSSFIQFQPTCLYSLGCKSYKRYFATPVAKIKWCWLLIKYLNYTANDYVSITTAVPLADRTSLGCFGYNY